MVVHVHYWFHGLLCSPHSTPPSLPDYITGLSWSGLETQPPFINMYVCVGGLWPSLTSVASSNQPSADPSPPDMASSCADGGHLPHPHEQGWGVISEEEQAFLTDPWGWAGVQLWWHRLWSPGRQRPSPLCWPLWGQCGTLRESQLCRRSQVWRARERGTVGPVSGLMLLL